jgi:hypothetical protein
MSIEMDNPKTLLEKVDAAANLVEQMYLSHKIHDDPHFEESHKRASDLLFEALNMIDE